MKKQGGIKSLSSNEAAKQIWKFCIDNKTYFFAAHLPGKHNILADFASAKFHDSVEGMLEPKILTT